MRVALITRATLFTQPGGDTVQVRNTAAALNRYDITADIVLTDQPIVYTRYDLLHFFNLTRPADILHHTRKARKPFVITPILVDFSQYDRYHRKGLPGFVFRMFTGDNIEYLKTTARWLMGKDKLMSKSYLWKRQRNSINEILDKATMVLPNSRMEYERLMALYENAPGYHIVPNGVDTDIFTFDDSIDRDPNLVICVGRIEGIKNQENLIRALNNTAFKLVLIGARAANQSSYYRRCRQIAAGNISFIDHLPQQQLAGYYQRAKVHVQPSWFETCSLSSLEAGVMGCNLVIADRGFLREYYQDYAAYCNPEDPASILDAVKKAAEKNHGLQFRNKILENYTWQHAAQHTAAAYHQALQTA